MESTQALGKPLASLFQCFFNASKGEEPHLFWQMGRELALDVHLANQGTMSLKASK